MVHPPELSARSGVEVKMEDPNSVCIDVVVRLGACLVCDVFGGLSGVATSGAR
ncbi:hypothetical protein SAMN04515692_105106 [Leifsonia sp. CL147]|nr:hypothetical protein SAMN04515692_105106 [Leifsonia sp. CL147]